VNTLPQFEWLRDDMPAPVKAKPAGKVKLTVTETPAEETAEDNAQDNN